MGVEQYANLGATTLSSGYTAGAGSIVVVSTAGSPAFSAAAPFRVVITDAATGAVKVILKVTAITDGTHFAVTAEGSDANAASSDNVYQILSAGGLDGIRSAISRSLTGALPSDGRDGDLLFPTDDSVLYRHNGSLFTPQGPIIPNLTNPLLTTFAWRNQGSASVVQTAGSEYLLAPILNGNNIKGREISSPVSTPFTITALMFIQAVAQNYSTGGLYFCDGTKLVAYGLSCQTNGTMAMVVSNYNSVTSFSGGVVTAGGFWGLIVLRITDDGTNHLFSWSLDNINFHLFKSVGRTAFFAGASTSVGYFAEGNNATYPMATKLLSWKVT